MAVRSVASNTCRIAASPGDPSALFGWDRAGFDDSHRAPHSARPAIYLSTTSDGHAVGTLRIRGPARRRPEDQRGDLVRRLVVQRRRDVAVHLQRDVHGRVTQPFLHDPRVDALLQRQRRPSVTEPFSVSLGRSSVRCRRRKVVLTVSGRRAEPSARWKTRPSSE